ncbi:MAG: hypothetical protein JNM84_15775 [Planctomycetes bacterium]|nr:hypothetical protein [Planctomycetota bacterium]
MSLLAALALPILLSTAPIAEEMPAQKSAPFTGIKANTGNVMLVERDGKKMLELSDDFVIPDTPAPHWQIVDALGRTHLLQRLPIKDGQANRKIALPAHVPSIAKVQIWCAFAETLLGETSFEKTVMLGDMHAHRTMVGKTGNFHGPKANAGYVTIEREGGQLVLTLSPEFVTPDTPAPHWQVVDDRGEVYLLNALKVKGDQMNRTIALPPYIQSVRRVQIWCAFAETLLGEAYILGHRS